MNPTPLNSTTDVQQGMDNFLAYLPQGIDHWIVAYQGSFHKSIVRELAGRLGSADFPNLEEETSSFVYETGLSYLKNDRAGFLEFAIRYPASVYDGHCPGNEGLDVFVSFPQDRVKLCFDVTDNNFDDLFSESPATLANRCHELRGRLSRTRSLYYDFGGSDPLVIQTTTPEWVPYTGFEHNSDYLLPSGEVSCLPESVDGRLTVEGWIIGTLPFGVKYGRIGKDELELMIESRKITSIAGSNRKLCSDIEDAISASPALQMISEAGIGQSLAVRQAAARHKLAYFWHERHYGLHLGLGAELPADDESKKRNVGGHHLDLVLASGRLSGDHGQLLLEW